jgi:hypothetical protein
MVFGLSQVAMFLAEAGHFDLGIRVGRLPLGPLLQLGHRFIASILFDKKYGEPALAGLVIRVAGQACWW